jgi:hypothetical protein
MARSLREMMLLVDGVALESLAATVDGRHSVDEYFRDAVENLLEAHGGGWWLDWLFYMSVLSHLRSTSPQPHPGHLVIISSSQRWRRWLTFFALCRYASSVDGSQGAVAS